MLVVRLIYLTCSLKKTVAGAAAMTPIDHASVPGSGQLIISPTTTIRRDFASEQRNNDLKQILDSCFVDLTADR